MPRKTSLENAQAATGASAAHAARMVGGLSELLAPDTVMPPVSQPVAVRAPHDTAREPDQPLVRRVDALDHITQQIGAKYWRVSARFDWCKMPNSYAHTFTRYYFQQYVLLDIFGSKGPAIEKEVAQKTAAIAQENVRRAECGQPPIGYLPTMRGANVPFEAFEAVKRGESLPLQVRIDLAAVPA